MHVIYLILVHFSFLFYCIFILFEFFFLFTLNNHTNKTKHNNTILIQYHTIKKIIATFNLEDQQSVVINTILNFFSQGNSISMDHLLYGKLDRKLQSKAPFNNNNTSSSYEKIQLHFLSFTHTHASKYGRYDCFYNSTDKVQSGRIYNPNYCWKIGDEFDMMINIRKYKDCFSSTLDFDKNDKRINFKNSPILIDLDMTSYYYFVSFSSAVGAKDENGYVFDVKFNVDNKLADGLSTCSNFGSEDNDN